MRNIYFNHPVGFTINFQNYWRTFINRINQPLLFCVRCIVYFFDDSVGNKNLVLSGVYFFKERNVASFFSGASSAKRKFHTDVSR